MKASPDTIAAEQAWNEAVAALDALPLSGPETYQAHLAVVRASKNWKLYVDRDARWASEDTDGTYERDCERDAERAYERQAEEACERIYGGCD
jgi:hypothetical protein